jgi:hypothetical protein
MSVIFVLLFLVIVPPSLMYQAFLMMFKALDMNVEIDFARVCLSECPVSQVMTRFFGSDTNAERYAVDLFKTSAPMTFHCSTFHVRQAMRDYLGSDDRLSTTDRSYLLRLKNARSASRCSLYLFWCILQLFTSFCLLFSQGCDLISWAQSTTILVPT